MLTDPVGPTLVRLATPMLVGIVSIVLFTVVDTWYVGRLGAGPLAAMTFTFPITLVVSNVVMGLGLGVSAEISHAVGAEDEAGVVRGARNALWIALALGGTVTGCAALCLEPLISGMGAEPGQAALALEYLWPWFLGISLLIFPMTANAVLRATGDTRTPSAVMMVSGLTNAALDPIFIFGLGSWDGLGIRGASIASVISWGCASAAVVFILLRRGLLTPRNRETEASWLPNLRTWGRFLLVGVPAAGTNIMAPISIGVLTGIMADHGEAAVAAFGVGQRLEALALVGMGALSSVVTPFVGQNAGAGKLDRVRTTVRFSRKAAITWGLTSAAVLAILSTPIARLFHDDPSVREGIASFLLICPIGYAGYGLAMLTNATLNGLRHPYHAAGIIIFRLFVLGIPLALVGSEWGARNGIFAALCVANLGVGLLAAGVAKRVVVA